TLRIVTLSSTASRVVGTEGLLWGVPIKPAELAGLTAPHVQWVTRNGGPIIRPSCCPCQLTWGRKLTKKGARSPQAPAAAGPEGTGHVRGCKPVVGGAPLGI